MVDLAALTKKEIAPFYSEVSLLGVIIPWVLFIPVILRHTLSAPGLEYPHVARHEPANDPQNGE